LKIEAIKIVLRNGDFASAPAVDYCALASLLLGNDAEAVKVRFSGNSAEITVTRQPPILETLTLNKTSAGWQLPP